MNSGYHSSASLYLKSAIANKNISSIQGKNNCLGFSITKNIFKRNIVLANGGIIKFHCFSGYDTYQTPVLLSYLHEYLLDGMNYT